jgi:hypothetical protein
MGTDIGLESESVSRQVSDREQLQLEIVLRDHSLGLQAQLAEAHFLLKRCQSEVVVLTNRLQAEMTRAHQAEIRANDLATRIDHVYSSVTWKIGRVVMLPIRLVRRLLGQ